MELLQSPSNRIQSSLHNNRICVRGKGGREGGEGRGRGEGEEGGGGEGEEGGITIHFPKTHSPTDLSRRVTRLYMYTTCQSL